MTSTESRHWPTTEHEQLFQAIASMKTRQETERLLRDLCTVSELYGPAIGDVHAVRPARITVEHVAPSKRIDVVGYVTVEAEGQVSDPGDVQCGIPGFDHPGTDLAGHLLESHDAALRWEIRGKRHASFTSDLERPKSPTLMRPPLSRKQLDGLMSRWMIPRAWAASRPSMTSRR